MSVTTYPVNHGVPGAERPEAIPFRIQRQHIMRRVRASEHALDLLTRHAFGEPRPEMIAWPVPVWAGAVAEAR